MSDNWIPLNQQLPFPNELVFWYDAMFDNIMLFSLAKPEIHDGDFTHFTRVIPGTRPNLFHAAYGFKEVGWYP